MLDTETVELTGVSRQLCKFSVLVLLSVLQSPSCLFI